MRAAVFPGQGSQAVGMGRALAEATSHSKDLFDAVDAALDAPLSPIMWDGPIETLTLTENAQPALMAASLATVRALEAAGRPLESWASFVAGHSLGEYSALCAAGALSVEDTARLLRIRGRAMQAAVPVGEGAMAAVLGLDLSAVEAIAADAASETGGVCEAANDNAPGQIVVSGSAGAVARAAELAKERGAKRALPLPVSAPFHCALMGPAAERMAAALDDVEIRAPRVPLVANVTAAPTSDPAEIKRLLIAQVTGRVRWRESVSALAEAGVDELIELGAGKVLSGLAKRIDARLSARAVGGPEEVAAFAADLGA